MGCDIHLVLERKHPTYGWVGTDSFQIHHAIDGKYCFPAALERNYRLFAALAGVRGDGPEPRGVPEDASALTRMLVDDWSGDGHSHSWLPLAEAAQEFNKRRWPEEGQAAMKSFRDSYPASFWFGVENETLEEHRLIFWFDN